MKPGVTSAPLPCRDNAWPLQPRSGPDHPCLCLPGSDGRPVLLRGPAHQGQEQTQAQETAHQTAHIPPTAADDDGEKPHCLIRTATFSCCWMESWVSLQNCSKRTTCVENDRVWRFGISWCLMDSSRQTRDFFNSNLPDFEGIQVSVGCWNSFRASCLFKAVRGCLCVRGLMNSIRQCYTHDVKCTLHIWHLTEKMPVSDRHVNISLSLLWPNSFFMNEMCLTFIFIEFVCTQKPLFPLV